MYAVSKQIELEKAQAQKEVQLKRDEALSKLAAIGLTQADLDALGL